MRDQGSKTANRSRLDLAAVRLPELDAATVIRDCELVARAARGHFPELQRIVTACGAEGALDLQAEALEIVERLGLAETAAAKAGGGLVGVLVIAGGVPVRVVPARRTIMPPS